MRFIDGSHACLASPRRLAIMQELAKITPGVKVDTLPRDTAEQRAAAARQFGCAMLSVPPHEWSGPDCTPEDIKLQAEGDTRAAASVQEAGGYVVAVTVHDLTDGLRPTTELFHIF